MAAAPARSSRIPAPLHALPGLEALWAETRGSRDIVIAVLDGPVERDHPVLSGAALSQLPTLAARSAGAQGGSDHGTHVTSIIFGQPGSPLHGLAPGCRGLLLPVYSQAEDGTLVSCSQMDLARAIHQALDAGAHVLNISGGQLTRTGDADHFLAEAVRRCAESNALIISAVGNDGCACLHVPAALPSVLAVGATDAAGHPLPFSNWGTAVQAHGVMAPGQHILGALPGGRLGPRTGTSFATPIVSGLAGLLLSLQIQRGDKPDPAAVRNALLKGAIPCTPHEGGCERVLAGWVDIRGALRTLFARQVARRSSRGHVMPTAQTADNGSRAEVRPAAAPSEGPTMVFSIGELSYDFGFEARLDYFIQRLGGKEANPVDPLKMAEHLRDNQEDANALIWTLNMDATPVYAIEPEDQFAVPTFLQLIRFMVEQEKEGVERISLAGHITGSTRLFNGSVVPTVAPVLRGMFNWNIEHLTRACFGEPPADKDKEARAQYDEKSKGLRSFLERIYFQLRNLGTSPQDRAMNFAATNAFQSKEVFEDAVKEQMVLDAINVERSPICRPDSDCWDVKLRFFDPAHRQERARKVYRYTVDVSDYVPVTVGRLRTWFEY